MSTPQDLGAALAAAVASRSAPQMAMQLPLALPTDTKIALLKQMFQSMQEPNKFEAGQLIKWKPGMQVRPYPLGGDPAIIVRVLDHPVYDGTADAGSPSFKEALDLQVGCLGPQGQFFIFHLPSFRFEPF
ncbi:hypothetical protein [Paraburkholderia sp. D1E]|uniref:hypothetical protein n=1 Tax=Paraburkholderia sp. D1E TaxID=3461398 RepID=UPI0040457C34